MLAQVVCRSCGYHRVWPTMAEALADGHRHAEHPPKSARPETRERACPHCGSAAVQARVRVFADNSTGRLRGEEYHCRDCAKEFMLLIR